MYSEVVSAIDLDIAARTVWGEARGDGSKVAVAWVIRNRAEQGGWWGNSLEEVCLKAWQFSAWNGNDPNRAKMQALKKDDPAYAECLAIVAGVLVSDHDPTDGANHYHAKGLDPDWAIGLTPCCKSGNHLFYNNVN